MFVTNCPALKIGKSIVIADLHIGIEHEILQRGIKIDQTSDLVQRTVGMLRRTRAKKLVIAGDVKHNIPYSKKEELKSLDTFIKEVSKRAEICIVPGNHDGSISRLVDSGVKIKQSSGFLLGEYGILHGHAKPCDDIIKNAKTIIIGHNHPLFRFNDQMGAWYFRKIWVRGISKSGKNIIIMPAFSDLAGGVIFNNVRRKKDLLGPVAREIVLSRSELFMLDGTCLGKIPGIGRH